MDETPSAAPVESTAAPADVTPEPTPTEGAGEVAANEQAPTAERPAWQIALDEAPPEEIRRHPKFAGIVGGELAKRQEAWKAAETERITREEQAKAQEELRRLARENPVAFADQWLGQQEAAEAQKRLADLETTARNSVAKNIGSAIAKTPEGTEIVNDAARFERIQRAMVGKSDDEALAAWNQAWIDEIADLRASKRAEAAITDRIAREREAWEAEAATAGLLTSARPALTRGRAATSTDPEPDWRTQPKEWNAWYARNR